MAAPSCLANTAARRWISYRSSRQLGPTPISASTTLNCGYGHGYSVRQVLEAVERVSGAALDISEVARRDGDPPELVAVASKIRTVLDWAPQFDDLVPKKRTETNTAAVLRMARQAVAESETLEPEPLEAKLRAVGEDSGWKPRELFMSIRFAVSGKKVTPPIIESMCILGQAECIERIDAAIDVLGNPENPILGSDRS